MGAKYHSSSSQRVWMLSPAMLAGVWTPEGLKLTCQELVPRAEQVGIGAGRPNGMILRPVFWGLVSCHNIRNLCVTLIGVRGVRNGCCGKNLVVAFVGPRQCSAASWMGKTVMRLQAMVKLSKSASMGTMCLDGISLLPSRSLLKKLGQYMAGSCCVPKTISNPAMSVDITVSVVLRSLLPESCRQIAGLTVVA